MLPGFIRRILGVGSFPRPIGQGLPDPAKRSDKPSRPQDPKERMKALQPTPPIKETK